LVAVGFWLIPHAFGRDEIVVPFSPLPPWKFIDDSGFAGAYAEVMRTTAMRLGKPIEFIECPLKRCLRFMETGRADLVIGLRASPDRSAYIRFLETPYRMSSGKVFYLKKGGGKSIRSHDDLYRLTIGTKLGAKYAPAFDDDTGIRKVAARSYPQNFDMLDRGRTDALIIAEDQGEYWISALGYRDKFEKAAFFYRDEGPRSLGVSRRSPLMREFGAVEAVMRQLIEDGTLEGIYRRQYFERFGIPMDLRAEGGSWVSKLLP